MYKKFDKIRAHREALKNAWFNMDTSTLPEVKTITVTMDKYPDRLGYGTVKVERQSPGYGYSSYSSLQANPFLYLSENKEFLSGDYELIVVDDTI